MTRRGETRFTLRELISAARAGERDAADLCPPDVEQLVPAGVSRSVLWRLGRLGPDALLTAQALATLGDESELRHVARLAELTPERAAKAADHLLGADLIRRERPLSFAHPVVRAAVYENIAPGARSSAHARAARMLAAEGVEPDRVALHLLATEPLADPWVVECLRKAAQEALARRAPDTAATYLYRALEEPPGSQARPAVLSELGFAEARAGRPDAAEHLALALEGAIDARERARIARALGEVLVMAGRITEAVQELDRAITELMTDAVRGERDMTMHLEAQLLGFCLLDRATQPAVGPRLDRLLQEAGSHLPHPRLQAHQAMHQVREGRSARRAARLAHQALERDLLADVSADSQLFYLAANALMRADSLREAEHWFEQARLNAQRRGSAVGFALASCWGGDLRYRQGALAEAEADARTALDITLSADWHHISLATLGVLLETLVERGDYATAADALDSCGLDIDRTEVPLASMARWGRARLRIAQGEVRDGLADVQAAGRLVEEWGTSNPAFLPWRSTAGLALASLGNHVEATRLAHEELHLARQFGAPRATGIALRAAGLITSGPSGIELLREAVTVLESSEATLELARALVDLGAGLRRAGYRREARELLQRGLDLAVRCHAGALRHRAHEELRVAGARPRRELRSGIEALSASELRVVKMAATGMTNRQIAQALFITTKTVETHLRHAYQKLRISSRAGLTDALTMRSETLN
jgi:DNA-binding CsgD family transcriptional regulator